MDSPAAQKSGVAYSNASNEKPVVVGIYGIPGSGKSHLLNQLKQELGQVHYAFHEGSEIISNLVPGGLAAFQQFPEDQKEIWRKVAVQWIGEASANQQKAAVVAGHFMFWLEGEENGVPAYTESDMKTYTHILYLDVPAAEINRQRQSDTQKERPNASVEHLDKWIQAEKTQLRELCHQRGIYFIAVFPPVIDKILTLLPDIRHHSEKYNLSLAENRLDEIIAPGLLRIGLDKLETMLVLDADRTLAPQDTGTLFWEIRLKGNIGEPLEQLFGGPLGYSYTAFRQAILMYEEATTDPQFEKFCGEVASMVEMYPAMYFLLRQTTVGKGVGAVIVTSGLRLFWEKVLEKVGLSETVKVIGGGRISDGFVVTAAVKAALVNRLQHTYQMHVFAFGDSPLDLSMLLQADHAIVVVGEEKSRSKSMDYALAAAIENNGLQAQQVLLPNTVSPRLDPFRLPIIGLQQEGFLSTIFDRAHRQSIISIQHATNKGAAKLLMTPMRDATVAGPALREAHRYTGRYLATEYLIDMFGREMYDIQHVQGHRANGWRFPHERETMIVALMRGGEPMALGVSDALPLAQFLHASSPDDIRAYHLDGLKTIILVDSVVNTGSTILEFVQRIRKLHSVIKIVVVAGVIQSDVVSGTKFAEKLPLYTHLSFLALRLSDNKFTGQGPTDTGNRLFNTTSLF